MFLIYKEKVILVSKLIQPGLAGERMQLLAFFERELTLTLHHTILGSRPTALARGSLAVLAAWSTTVPVTIQPLHRVKHSLMHGKGHRGLV